LRFKTSSLEHFRQFDLNAYFRPQNSRLKMSHWIKSNFLTTNGYFLPKFQDLQRKLSTIRKNVTKIFSLHQELQLLQHYIPYVKNSP